MHKEAEFLQKLLPGYYMVRMAQHLGPDLGLSWQLFCPKHCTGHVFHLGFFVICPPSARDKINTVSQSQSQKHKSCQLLANSVGTLEADNCAVACRHVLACKQLPRCVFLGVLSPALVHSSLPWHHTSASAWGIAVTQPPWFCGETTAVPGYLPYLLFDRVTPKAVAGCPGSQWLQYQGGDSCGTRQLCTSSLLQIVVA